MYKVHPAFKKPQTETVKLWRYMDFTKFVSLLDKSALFFCRVDKLEDQFEGSYSKANIPFRTALYDCPENELKGLSELHERAKQQLAINCWHLSECESCAMWKLYLRSDCGIAIQSSFKRLTDSFAKEKRDVFIGKIKYIDYKKDIIPEGNIFWGFMHKRKSFEHEKEMRAVIQLPLKNGKPLVSDGLFVSVDLDTLIESVYLAPKSARWIRELVYSVQRKYGLNKKTIQSDLDDIPVY